MPCKVRVAASLAAALTGAAFAVLFWQPPFHQLMIWVAAMLTLSLLTVRWLPFAPMIMAPAAAGAVLPRALAHHDPVWVLATLLWVSALLALSAYLVFRHKPGWAT